MKTLRNELKKPLPTLPDVCWLLIDPPTAAELLAQNTWNRSFRPRNLDALAGAMRDGTFAINGDPVRIYSDGVIADGQHRLKAIVLSAHSQWCLVVFNLPKDIVLTIDRNSRRSNSDDLTMRGEKNTTTMAGAITWLYRMERGVYHGAVYASPQENLRILDANPSLAENVRLAGACRDLIPNAQGAALLTAASASGDGESCREFIGLVATGEMLQAGMPAYELRKRLIFNKDSRAKLPAHVVFALVLKAFIAHRDGRTIHNLRWRDGEEFPSL